MENLPRRLKVLSWPSCKSPGQKSQRAGGYPGAQSALRGADSMAARVVHMKQSRAGCKSVESAGVSLGGARGPGVSMPCALFAGGAVALGPHV